MPNKIILADISSVNINGTSEGHYFSVAKNYLDIFKNSLNIVIAGGPVYKNIIQPSNLITLPYDSKKNNFILDSIKKAMNGFFLLKGCTDKDILIFQSSAISVVLLLLSILRVKPKVYLIQYDNSTLESPIKRHLFRRAKRNISGIICPGSEVGENFNLKYCIVPDYIYKSKEIVSKQKYEYDFGIYGVLSNDKGISEITHYLVKNSNPSIKIHIAGKVADKAEDKEMFSSITKLSKYNDNLTIEQGYLSEKRYNELLSKTKYIVLNYSDSYATRSSGVILDAIYNRIPVIVKNRSFVNFVKENNLGLVYSQVDEINIQELLCDDVYKKYISSITEYLNKQLDSSKELTAFILGEKS